MVVVMEEVAMGAETETVVTVVERVDLPTFRQHSIARCVAQWRAHNNSCGCCLPELPHVCRCCCVHMLPKPKHTRCPTHSQYHGLPVVPTEYKALHHGPGKL